MKYMVVGDVGIDHYVYQNIYMPGGIALNVACGIGLNTCLLASTVGNDQFGVKILDALQAAGADTKLLSMSNGTTARQAIKLKTSGERVFNGYSPGVLKGFQLGTSVLAEIAKSDLVFVPLTDSMEGVVHAVANCSTRGLKAIDFSQDYKFADFSEENNIVTKYGQNFDIIFIGGNESMQAWVKDLSNIYPQKVFVLTMGAKGSIASSKGKQYKQPAFNIGNPVDTTGCGDAFQGSFMKTYLESGGSIPDALANGSLEAAKIALQLGPNTLN